MRKTIYVFSVVCSFIFISACKKTTVTAEFSSNIQSGNAPLQVTFTDQSTISSGSITGWVWNFGDGTTSNEQNPTHTYSSAGSYDVTLTASGKGESNTQTKKAYIIVSSIPTEKIIEIKTSFGTMYMWLYKQTPQHRSNFLKLADSGFFDGITFHRIIKDFVIQGGDPNSLDSDTTNDGTGGPGYTIPAEFVDSLKHDYGAIGAARTQNPQKASSGSQFYIVTNKAGTHQLDKNYTVFGKIISGVDIAYTISTQPKNAYDRPLTDIKMDVNVIEKTLQQLKTEFNFVP